MDEIVDGEVVVGMAEAVERRRKELGLTPGQFAARAGLTTQGVAPVRKGLRRAYQDKVKLGVAAALQWPTDCIDRLMAGEDPSTFDPRPSRALDEGPALTELQEEVAELRRLVEEMWSDRDGGARG